MYIFHYISGEGKGDGEEEVLDELVKELLDDLSAKEKQQVENQY